MKRLLFITEEYPPTKGGVGRFMHQLAHNLPRENRYIVAPTREHTTYDNEVNSINFSHRWVWPRWLPTLFTLIRVAKKNRIDQICCSSVLPLGILAYLLNKMLHIPYTVIVVGMDVMHIKNNKWKVCVAKKILQRADSIISISTFSRNQLSFYGIDPERVTIITPQAFCRPETHKPKLSDLLITHVQNKKIILSVGRLVKRKNFETVIAVAEKMKGRKDVIFFISGTGPEKNSLLDLINKGGVQDTVFIIEADDFELAALYSQSRCVLFLPTSSISSGDVEGFGIVAVEAASFGTPVIASNQGGVPDAVSDGKSGHLVNPTDVNRIYSLLLRYIDDEPFYQQMKNSSKEFYTQQINGKNQKKVLRQLFGFFEEKDISVIIPAYNSELTIKKCLHSVLAQTHQPLEIIVVDDGSTDNTNTIVRTLFPNITLVKQKNSGAPSARNAGARIAKGTYIIFLDSDIECHPKMFELMKKQLMSHPDISYAYSCFTFGWKKFPSYSFDEAKLKQYNYIHTSSLIRKIDFFGFDESLKRHQDWDLWLSMLEKGKKGILIKECLYKIHLQKNRISSWLPSIFYKVPFLKRMKSISDYEQSADIIRKKHNF